MTASLRLIALFSLVALSSSAAAEAAGFSVPAIASGEAALGLFVITIALLLLGHDYGRHYRLDTPARRIRLLPAAEAFGVRRAPSAQRRDRSRRTFKPTVMR